MRGLSIARKQAKKLRDKYSPNERCLDVKKIAQMEGIRVEEEIFDQDMSGLFLKDDGKYIIAVNADHSTVRQRFTIAHELGHYVLHKEESLHYDPIEAEKIFFRAEGVISSHETEANHFAAELLMPEALVLGDFKSTPNISTLAEQYGVSEQAMMYRLVNLGLM